MYLPPLELPIARATVRFSRQAMLGLTIAGLFQETIRRCSVGDYIEQRRYFDGEAIIFGKRPTKYECGLRAVASHGDLPYLLTNVVYDHVQVVDYGWTTPWPPREGLQSTEAVIAQVTNFASHLHEAYNDSFVLGLPGYICPGSDEDAGA